MRYAILLLLLLLYGCGGGKQQPEVENPYVDRVQTLNSSGVAMMQRERWSSAEKTFQRALLASQLADDTALTAQSWYNLAIARSAMGDRQKAEEAFLQSMTVAERHEHELTHMRAKLGLAMSRARAGQQAWTPPPLEKKWSVDVHLSAARLAQYQARMDVAREEYERAANQSDKKTRIGLTYRAEAHMGLAMLAHASADDEAARKETEHVLRLCRKVGAPRLAAHTLLLRSRLDIGVSERQDSLERSLSIYRALKDRKGQRVSLEALVSLAEDAGEDDQAAYWRQRLDKLPAEIRPEVAPLSAPETSTP